MLVFGCFWHPFFTRRGVDHECDDSWFMNGDREGLTSRRWPDGEEVDGVDGIFLCNRNKRKSPMVQKEKRHPNHPKSQNRAILLLSYMSFWGCI